MRTLCYAVCACSAPSGLTAYPDVQMLHDKIDVDLAVQKAFAREAGE